MKNTYYAIISAAGQGQRMGAEKPKQYLKISGKTILEYAVNVLADFPLIEKVIVALGAKDHYWPNLQFNSQQKILTTLGGSTRAESVFNALEMLSEFANADDWVLVHDAARPCLRSTDVKRLIETVGEHPVGGILGIPINDTLKLVNSATEIIKTQARENVWCAQTPQLFRLGLLKKALKQALNTSPIPTDDCSAIEMIGLKPLMVLGGVHNLKITYPDDLLLAEKYLNMEVS